MRSAACWVASACRRKRSGAASHTLARSKKSNVRTRLATRLHGRAGSAARRRSTAVSTRARPSWTRLARRSTAMISATSDSTADTTSAVATWSLETTASRRSRDSASAGNASSASKAIVRRRPWPSFWWRSAGGARGSVALRRCAAARVRASAALLRTASPPRGFLAVAGFLAAIGFFAAAVACMRSLTPSLGSPAIAGR